MTGFPLGAGTERLHQAVRRHIAPLGDDRYQTPDLERATDLVRSGELGREVRAALSPEQNKCAAWSLSIMK